MSLIMCVQLMAYDFESDGVFYNILSTSDLTIEVTKGDYKYSGEIIIPESVTFNTKQFKTVSIDMDAFRGSDIISVSIPQTITKIESGAFYQCENLEYVDLPISVTKVGSYIFGECKKLTQIPFKEGSTEMGDDTFRGCSSLVNISIPSTISSLGDYVFMDCENIETVILPKNLQTIGRHIFRNCPNIKDIKILNPYPITTSSTDEYWTPFDRSVYLNANVTVPSNSLAKYQRSMPWKNFLLLSEDTELGIASYIDLTLGKNGKLQIDGIDYYAGNGQYDNTPKSFSFGKCKGDVVELDFMPNDGYRMGNFKINGLDINLTSNSYTLTIDEESYEITVEFIPIFTLGIINNGDFGTVKINDSIVNPNESDSFIFDFNSNVDIYLELEDGYGSHVQCYNVNGNPFWTSAINKIDEFHYILSNYNANISLEFTYSLNSYSIKGSCGNNGSFTQNGQRVTSSYSSVGTGCNHGDSLHIELLPDNNYTIGHLYVNGVDVADEVVSNAYDIDKVKSDITINCTFVRPQPFTIKCGEGGSVTIFSDTIKSTEKTIYYRPGSSTSFIVAPYDGYVVKQIVLDGTQLSGYVSQENYPLNNIEGSHNISAYFEPAKPEHVCFTSTIQGCPTVSSILSFNSKAIIDLNIPNGWSLASAFFNGDNIVEDLKSGHFESEPLIEDANFLGSLEYVDFTYSEEDNAGVITALNDSGISLEVGSGKTIIKGLNGEKVLVYSMSGMLIKDIPTALNTLTLELIPSSYIIRIEGSKTTSFKVLIK